MVWETFGETESRQIKFMVLLKHLSAKSFSPGLHSKRDGKEIQQNGYSSP